MFDVCLDGLLICDRLAASVPVAIFELVRGALTAVDLSTVDVGSLKIGEEETEVCPHIVLAQQALLFFSLFFFTRTLNLQRVHKPGTRFMHMISSVPHIIVWQNLFWPVMMGLLLQKALSYECSHGFQSFHCVWVGKKVSVLSGMYSASPPAVAN